MFNHACYIGYNISIMKKRLVFILVLILIADIALAKGYKVTKKVGEYEAEIRIDNNPPIIGDNNIGIEIKDSAGRHVTDARVLVNYYMPPMPRMVPMNYRTDAKLKGDKYGATMKFIMSGPWIIAIKIFRQGKTLTTKVSVDVQ
jgi:hypothetical protein